MSSIRTIGFKTVTAVLTVCAACSPKDTIFTRPGDPLPGLSPAQLGRFQRGEALFNHTFSVDEGLGPLFNENQCSACHTFPASGGTGEQFARKAATLDSAGVCDPLSDEGGENIRSQATAILRAIGVTGAVPPHSATQHARFNVTFLYGLGLVDAIDDATIVAREDSNDTNGDGISGRASRASDGGIGRFGRKAEFSSLRGFVESALRFEMGLTTPAYPNEVWAQPISLPRGADPAKDPEINSETLEVLTDYVRYLAPISRMEATSTAHADSIARGERLFDSLGCSGCHVPQMDIGDELPGALGSVGLYSDLLLHDMGEGLVNVCGTTSTATEVRTELLMGLRYRNVYLHDGRAGSITEAIEAHGGEASNARRAFGVLNRLSQEFLLVYLRTL